MISTAFAYASFELHPAISAEAISVFVEEFIGTISESSTNVRHFCGPPFPIVFGIFWSSHDDTTQQHPPSWRM